ncbi:uncharacterized protein MAM_03906 [Metarhizium album ARSEF 1941]|uniref:Uncharacterized protein n=1 Tax=Metarhizium album (strain ARSEF 1941) TaxID=1081103 RepID=A0A0B2WZ57_METAS|nr:uncharacterized protein MAM_03906 [Metarhizium album ARSEF 1941]KHN98145.1 hypothetical protein MAM_03906 [Metarhizium album ARSEF 1941]
MATPQPLPAGARAGADPLADAADATPIPQAFFLVLFCLFVVLFIRITHFTLSDHHEYAITRSIECQHRRGHEPSCSPCREMPASSSCAGFNTMTSPGDSPYLPNLVFGDSIDRNSTPLLARREHGAQTESVAMDPVAGKAEEDWEGYSALNGTNNLNTPSSWTA